jgi:transcription initiation factor TFIIIB Brf1 subunit/transcription initiation factor TFIIB
MTDSACPDCGQMKSTWYAKDKVLVCDNCGFILGEEL